MLHIVVRAFRHFLMGLSSFAAAAPVPPVELRSALADSMDRLRSAKKYASKTDFRTS